MSASETNSAHSFASCEVDSNFMKNTNTNFLNLDQIKKTN